jgi:GNAT superfamily N-acetyltransferase
VQFDPHELARAAALLNEVFDAEPPYSVERLAWYYEDNPVGPAAVGRVDDGVVRTGNYALVPQTFRDAAGRAVVLGLGVDLAVAPEARGAGTFRRTVEDSYGRGAAHGIDAIIGVANANSAPRMVTTLGWRLLDALPVTLVAPAARSVRMQHRRVDDAMLDSAWFDAVAGAGFVRSLGTSGAFEPVWTGDYLRWRLARPGARYTLHVGEDVVVVSTTTTMRHVRFAMVLKVLARRPLSVPLSLGRVARSLMVHHRTPFVVHWGRNPFLRIRGVRLPQEKMPSPLTLVLHRLRPGFDEDAFELGSFEFFDFDAY